MLDLVLSPFLLALEAERVVEMRLVLLAWGGPAALVETHIMVAEKVAAAVEATTILMTGGSLDRVVARYREHVAANAARLSAGSGPPSRVCRNGGGCG